MPYYFFQWDDETVQHLAEHGVTTEDFQAIVSQARVFGRSKSTSREMAFGWTGAGEFVACVFERIEADTIIPITAYEVEH